MPDKTLRSRALRPVILKTATKRITSDKNEHAVQGTFNRLFEADNQIEDISINRNDINPTLATVYTSKKHAAVRTEEYLYNQLIPYIGNKRKLLWLIAEAIKQTGVTEGTYVDFFAGSSVVARLAKTLGFRLIANDWEPYAKTINHCYVECNGLPKFDRIGGLEHTFEILNNLEPIDGYIARHLCPVDDAHPDLDTERMFFTHVNGGKIDAMREQIKRWEEQNFLTVNERVILLSAILYSASYVSNTSGVFKGFHRGWGGNTQTALYRILSRIELRLPVLYDNHQCNISYQLDAQVLAAHLRATNQPIDIAYLDPPYNQHPYGSNYHVLNTIALWDKPDLSPSISGRDKAAIRLDWRTERRSAYNHATALSAYDLLLNTIQARYILTSYSTDGNIPVLEMLRCAARRGFISCIKKPYKRYRVSSQRMSHKPINVEFVLVIDTCRRSTNDSAERIYDDIIQMERTALSSHKENHLEDNDTLF